MNHLRSLTPQVRLDIVDTPESMPENPVMAVIGRRKILLDTGKTLPLEHEELHKHQRKSMSCMEVG